MREKTLTFENLLAIFEAMSKIHVKDRSLLFEQYYIEVITRMSETVSIEEYLKQQETNQHESNYYQRKSK